MQKTEQEQKIIVRGSAEHKDYLRYQFGRIKETVNGFETRIAVSGRAMLLIYVVYITVKAGVVSSLPANLPPYVSTGLLVLDIAMLALQVLGLEGSVPGLRHLAEELEDKGKTKEAGTVRFSSNVAQWLLAATAVDIILQKTPVIGSWDMTGVATAYTNGLFVLRVVVIGLYLVAMAKLEHKGPKVISAHEAEKQAEEQEQKQIRIDNATIMTAVEQGIADWAKKQPDINAAFSESIHRLEGIVSQKIDATQQMQNDKLASMHRLVEALQFGASSTNSGGSLESILPHVEAMLSRSNVEVRQAFESRLDEVKSQVSQVEAATATQVRQLHAKLEKATSEAAASRSVVGEVAKTVERLAKEGGTATQATASNIIPIARQSETGLTKEDVLRLIEADASLASLSDSMLAAKVGATKSTANRAKKEWSVKHPESPQQGDSGRREAMNE